MFVGNYVFCEDLEGSAYLGRGELCEPADYSGVFASLVDLFDVNGYHFNRLGVVSQDHGCDRKIYFFFEKKESADYHFFGVVGEAARFYNFIFGFYESFGIVYVVLID